jgi:hypothetical protein
MERGRKGQMEEGREGGRKGRTILERADFSFLMRWASSMMT